LGDFIKENNIDWSKYVGIGSHGRCSGVVAHMKAVSLEAKFIHCCIHRESLVTKKILAELRAFLGGISENC
jgi:hypothetical protein